MVSELLCGVVSSLLVCITVYLVGNVVLTEPCDIEGGSAGL